MIKLYRAPPQYDDTLFKLVMILMRVALIAHLCFSFWIYTNEEIFNLKSTGIDQKIQDQDSSLDQIPESPFKQKLSSDFGISIILLICFCLLFYIIEYFFIKCLLKCADRVDSLKRCLG